MSKAITTFCQRLGERHTLPHGRCFHPSCTAACKFNKEKPVAKTGIELIAEERARQINEKGWTPEHDAQHYEGNIALAGATYAMHACCQIQNPDDDLSGVPADWPWDDKFWKPSTNIIRNLTKAGALIAAEIDRVLRQQEQDGKKV